MKAVRWLIIAALGALLVVPSAFANAVNGQDKANAARDCSALRTSLTLSVFAQTYGTNADLSNAFGKCVSKLAVAEHATQQKASAACAAEQADPNFATSHDEKTFDQFYGTGKKGANAFGNCVSGKAKTAMGAVTAGLVKSARSCKAERQNLGAEPFKTKYGTNASKSNAFGKCVSKLASAS
jgi:hypothetical protein